jgi:hypothetical protein
LDAFAEPRLRQPCGLHELAEGAGAADGAEVPHEGDELVVGPLPGFLVRHVDSITGRVYGENH